MSSLWARKEPLLAGMKMPARLIECLLAIIGAAAGLFRPEVSKFRDELNNRSTTTTERAMCCKPAADRCRRVRRHRPEAGARRDHHGRHQRSATRGQRGAKPNWRRIA